MAELATSRPIGDQVAAATESIDADKREAYERGKTDFNFFAGLMAPTVMTSMFPVFYIGLFLLLTARKDKDIGRVLRFALGLPRGHAKTTFIKILIAWLIVYDKISFVVVICATMPLAVELLADVHDMLGSENARLVYGDWDRNLSTDNKEMKKCMYHGRPVILVAKGADTAVRGINIKHQRPDLIFCDDAQTKENDDSPTERLKFRIWLVGMFKIIRPKGDRLIIYVGNMYSEECMLAQLKASPSWVSLVTGAIKEDGTPLWPELHSLDELMESFEHDESLGEADVWFAEVMNDPVSKARSLITGSFAECPWEDDAVVPDGVFLTIDPAGFRDISDDNVIWVHYVYDGVPALAAMDNGEDLKDPEQLIIRALQLAMDHGASVIGIEDVAYQITLMFWVRKYILEAHISGLHVVPLNPHGRSKEQRIRLLMAELVAGTYYIWKKARSLFTWQAMAYKIGKKKNKDDILDSAAYGMDMRAQYWHLIRNNKATGRWLVEARVQDHNTPF